MHTLGIDLGGTYARAGVVDAEGRILAAAKTALTQRTPEAVVVAIQGAAKEALAQAGAPQVVACGIGVAGQLKPGGVVSVAPNLGWRDVPFGQLLATALGRTVRVVNDLAAAAWGELIAGAGRGVNDLFVVFVGSGVGSSIISGGRQLTGATGVAGEFGHTKVVPRPDARLCGCGERGCLEAYASGHNLHKMMREAVEKLGPATRLHAMAGGDLSRLTSASLEQAAEAGDSAAKEIHDAAALYLGVAIANMVTVLNPARLILGGGVINHSPGLRRRVEEHVMTFANANARAAVQVRTAALGDDSGLIGAALLAQSAQG